MMQTPKKLAAPPQKRLLESDKRQHQQNQGVNVNLLKTPIRTTWIQPHKTVKILDKANCNK